MDKTIPEKILDQTLKDQINLDKYSVGLNNKIQKLLKDAQGEIVAAIAKNDPTAPTMTKWKAARLEKLNEDISVIVDTTYKEIAKTNKGELLKMAGTQKDHVVSSLNKAVGADIFNVTLTPEGVKGIVENTLIDGNVIGEWWSKQSESTKAKMAASMAAGTQALQVGMVQGESVGDLISRIRGTKTTPGVMSMTKREAEALVRTSVMQVSNAVRQETYKANADVLNGIEFVATLDMKTCSRCRPYDGKKYDMNLTPLSGMSWPGLPVHFNCFIDGQIPIYTSKGWKPIRKIQIGDLVLTHKGRFRKVTDLIFTPKQVSEVVRISIKGKGYINSCKVTMTIDHPVMINGDWKPAGAIKNGDKISFLSHKCGREECNIMVPHVSKFCSQSCRSLENIKGQWTKDRKKIVSIKNRKSNLDQYESGLRDRFETTKNANKKTREMVADGTHPFQNLEVHKKAASNAHNSKRWRAAVVEYMSNNNPSLDPVSRSKQTMSLKKFYKDHPEKHPNVIMAQKGFSSSLELKMKAILDEFAPDYIQQHPVLGFYVDFALPDLNIVIEVDGEYWHQDKEKDARRQQAIENQGWKVLRFCGDQINNNLEDIRQEIFRIASNHAGLYEFAYFEVEVLRRWRVSKPCTLYNFSVDEDESYIARGFVVHNCRCTSIPSVKSYEELSGPNSPLTSGQIKEMDANIPTGMRASMNGPVPGNLSYNDWLLLQSEDIQKEILGKGKWSLWQANKLDMVDLVNNDGMPLTLKELQATMGDILAAKEAVLESLIRQMALEAESAEALMSSISERLTEEQLKKALRIMDGEGGPSQLIADTKKTIEAQRVARAEARMLKELSDPNKIAVFEPRQKLPAGLYNPIKEVDLPTKVSVDEPVFMSAAGKRPSAGVIMIEQDGRVWIVSPKGEYGGYKNTFAKGSASGESALNLQRTAIKEVFEETGMQGEILGYLGDYEKTTSTTRYYIGRRIDGSPSMMGPESEAVKLVPQSELKGLMNVAVDQKVADDLIIAYNKAMKLGDGDFAKGVKELSADRVAGVRRTILESEFNWIKIDYPEAMREVDRLKMFEESVKTHVISKMEIWASAERTAERKAYELYSSLENKDPVRAYRAMVDAAKKINDDAAIGLGKLDYTERAALKSLKESGIVINSDSAYSILDKVERAAVSMRDEANKVIRLTDKQIKDIVDDNWLGPTTEKDYLANSLIARRNYIQDYFAEVDAVAKPTAPAELSVLQKDTLAVAKKRGVVTTNKTRAILNIEAGLASHKDVVKLSKIIADQMTVCCNIPMHDPNSGVYKSLMKEPVMKNQFVRGRSGSSQGSHAPYKSTIGRDGWERTLSGGILQENPVYKEMADHAYFETPAQIEAAYERPIYGFVLDSTNIDSANNYGQLTVVFKPEVRLRSTFTMGNSSGLKGQESTRHGSNASNFPLIKRMTTTSIDSIKPQNIKELLDGKKKLNQVGFGNGYDYIEAQIYGKTELTRDAQFLVWRRTENIPDFVQKFADRIGVKVYNAPQFKEMLQNGKI